MVYIKPENQQSSVHNIHDALNSETICVAATGSRVSFQSPQENVLPNLQLFPRIGRKKARSGPSNKLSRGNISLNALVLDSGASLHLMVNEDMLQNICTDSNPTSIHCGGKSWSNNQVGQLCDELKVLPLPQDDLHLHKD
jgi:hypothetical protein